MNNDEGENQFSFFSQLLPNPALSGGGSLEANQLFFFFFSHSCNLSD